jgi:hypothetical protein
MTNDRRFFAPLISALVHFPDMTYVHSTATPAECAEIEQFILSYYLFDETLNAAAGIRDIDFRPAVEVIVPRCLETPFSFVARHSGGLVRNCTEIFPKKPVRRD